MRVCWCTGCGWETVTSEHELIATMVTHSAACPGVVCHCDADLYVASRDLMFFEVERCCPGTTR